MSRPLVQWEHRPYTGTHTELARVRADLGTNVWATFTLDPDTIPPGLAPYIFTH